MENEKRNIDVVCIANYPSAASLKYLRKTLGNPVDGAYFPPLYYRFLNTSGAVVALNSSHTDLMNIPGIKSARMQFISALNSIIECGVKVVVLAASLKRLFGKYGNERITAQGVADKDGKTLRELYPGIIFTNGDNGTSMIFSQEIDYILSIAGVSKGRGRVAVLGAGILGTKAIRHLVDLGINDSQLFVISSYNNEVKETLRGHDNVTIVASIEEVETNIDAIICCTHNKPLSQKQLEMLDCNFVLDVAVPAGFPEAEYAKCKGVYRQDAGNAYSPNLHYEFDCSGIDLGSTKEMYGCFAEGTVLAEHVISSGYDFEDWDLRDVNFFYVDSGNSYIAGSLFDRFSFSRHPEPLCFGVPV